MGKYLGWEAELRGPVWELSPQVETIMQSLKMRSHIYGNEARLLGKSSRVQQVIKAEAGCRSLPLKSLCGIHTEISKKRGEKMLLVGTGGL